MTNSSASVQVFHSSEQPFEWRTLPIPEELAPGEVVVALTLATICGSDLHTVLGKRIEPTPSILGHEGVGVVVRCGSGRQLVEGTRVTWTIADSCGTCDPCKVFGVPQKCTSLFKYGHATMSNGCGLNGTYASHILLRAGTCVVPIPDVVPDCVAVPANCALATMVSALASLPSHSRTAAVQGAGMLGLYSVALLRDRGFESIYVIDISPQRLALAEEFGAIPINSSQLAEHGTSPSDEILKRTPGGVDVVIEVAGVSSLVSDGVKLMRVGGHYSFVGMVHPDSVLPITGETIIRKCMSIKGTHNYTPDDLQFSVDFLSRTVNSFPYAKLVSPPIALRDIAQAVDAAKSGNWIRVAVRP